MRQLRVTSTLRWGCALSIVCGVCGLARFLVACGESGSGLDATMPRADVGCGLGLVSCSGECVDPMRDQVHCGACGNACKSENGGGGNAEVCMMGTCQVSCGGGASKCSDQCVDLRVDPSNCGACGAKCSAGFLCKDGGCALSCMDGLAACPTDGGELRCTNRQTDNENCGMCGNTCDPGFACQNALCVISCQMGLAACVVDGGARCIDPRIDPENCGTCGTICEAGTFCSPPADAGPDGAAGVCGLACFGGTTKCGNRCVDTKIDPYNCNGCNMACEAGLSCVMSTCQ